MFCAKSANWRRRPPPSSISGAPQTTRPRPRPERGAPGPMLPSRHLGHAVAANNFSAETHLENRASNSYPKPTITIENDWQQRAPSHTAEVGPGAHLARWGLKLSSQGTDGPTITTTDSGQVKETREAQGAREQMGARRRASGPSSLDAHPLARMRDAAPLHDARQAGSPRGPCLTAAFSWPGVPPRNAGAPTAQLQSPLLRAPLSLLLRQRMPGDSRPRVGLSLSRQDSGRDVASPRPGQRTGGQGGRSEREGDSAASWGSEAGGAGRRPPSPTPLPSLSPCSVRSGDAAACIREGDEQVSGLEGERKEGRSVPGPAHQVLKPGPAGGGAGGPGEGRAGGGRWPCEPASVPAGGHATQQDLLSPALLSGVQCWWCRG